MRTSIVANGIIIEDYPSDVRGPSALVLCFLQDGDPVHTVWAWRSLFDEPFLITIYRPDASGWSADFRIRLP